MKNSEPLLEAPLTSHLADLRKRLIYAFIAFILVSVSCFIFIEHIFLFLLEPLKEALGQNTKVTYLAPHEAFFTYMNISIYAGLILSMPVILLQIWKFIAPGLYSSEQKTFIPFLVITPLMFYIGCAFAFYFVLPKALAFFADFQTLNLDDIKIIQETRVSDYAHFAMSFILVFGLAFEMPVIIILLGKIEVINAEFLRKNRGYVIMIIAVISALFTPPDIISMLLLALPLYLMYEIATIWISSFKNKTEPKC